MTRRAATALAAGFGLATALAAALAPVPGRADGPVDAAVKALRGDGTLKVRAQAAIVLGQRGGPEAVAALRGAAAGDPSTAVRLAAVSALSRLGPLAARTTLQAASQADPEPAVRDAAAHALEALGPVTLAVGEPAPGARADLKAALARQLTALRLPVAEPAELRLVPSAAVETAREGGKVVVSVRASLSAVDGDGHVVLLERSARASLAAGAAEARVAAATAQALDAALRGLCEDLAARLGR